MRIRGPRGFIVVVAVFSIAAFYFGTRYQKHREDLKYAGAALVKYVASLVAVSPPANEQVSAQLAIEARGRVISARPVQASRKLDTTLLPLTIDTTTIPDALGIIAGAGGGMTVIGDKIIVVDLHGAFFKVEGKGELIERLNLPPLPNHAEEYRRFGAKPIRIEGNLIVNSWFGVHDIEARIERGGIRLFVSYERYLPEPNTTALAVSSIAVSESVAPLGGWEDVYQSQPLRAAWYSGIAGGGRMLVSGDYLYLTVGDYNQDNVFMSSRLMAQSADSDFGKILKIDLRSKTKSQFSIGHRVPQGLVLTSAGKLYATEHGPKGGDELNEIVEGRNYGWPVTTLGTHYWTYDWPNRKAGQSEDGFTAPVYAWLPSIGASNLIEIRNFNPAWDNDLLVTSLIGRSLHRLRQDSEGRVLYSEPIGIGERLRDAGSLPDGTLVFWTDEAHLIFVSVDAAALAANTRPLP